MRAHFLLGPAGSGKTHRCLTEIQEALVADPLGPPLILLAPRQATYQLELALLSQPGLTGYTRLRITSFERFAAWVLWQLKVGVRDALSQEGRVMVLRALLHRHHAELKVFGASCRSTGFAQLLSDQLLELQQHRVSPKELRARAGQITEHPALADKLRDLACLLELYLGWLERENVPDAGTQIDQAIRALQSAARQAGEAPLKIAGLWLDGMAELTPQELELLAALVPFCERATLAFCLESEPVEEPSWLSTWSVISQTFRRCHSRLAAESAASVDVEVLRRDALRSRFSRDEENKAEANDNVLRHLESAWTTGAILSGPTTGAGTALKLVGCSDPEQEATMAAREILTFVQAGNRFRDCAVLLRRMETHDAGLRRVFTRYQIPFFLDRRESIAHHPLAELTRSALHTVLFGWRFTDWFAALKTGLTPLETDEVDRLENAALARGWEGSTWLRPLELEDDPAQGQACETMRRRVIGPFEKLRGLVTENPTGRELAGAIRRFWEALDVESTLERMAIATAASAQVTTYEELNGWLDNLERGFGGFQLPMREWLPILEAGLGTLTAGAIPPAIDQVLIGTVDRSRNPDVKLALVLGLNEGAFPLSPTCGGLLTEADRAALANTPMRLGGDNRSRLGHERYLGYIACTRARERLILSWSERDAAGRALNRSSFIDHVCRILPLASCEHFQPVKNLSDCIHASEQMEAAGPLLRTLLEQPNTFVARNQSDAPILDSIASPTEFPVDTGTQELTEVMKLLGPAAAHILDYTAASRQSRLSAATVGLLYQNELRTSASRLEQFAACPFQFFAQSTLRARERDRFEVDTRKTGTLMHEILRCFHQELEMEHRRWRDVAPNEARERIARIAREQRNRVAQGVLSAQPRHVFLSDAITALLQDFVVAIINWMGACQFDPIAVELGIGGKPGRLPAWRIDLGSDRTLLFRGNVDRVDAAPCPGRDDALGLAVMDYKSGNKRFDSLKWSAGLQLQLPAYLAALCEVANGTELLSARQAIPAGMFYVRLRGSAPRIVHRNDRADAKAARRFEHTGRFSFEWLPMFDRQFETGGSGQFTYKLKKDGEPAANGKQLVRQTELNGMLAETKELMVALGREILSGNIAVDPYRKGSEIPCAYCEFKTICRIDPWTHAYRPLRPIVGSPGDSAEDRGQ